MSKFNNGMIVLGLSLVVLSAVFVPVATVGDDFETMWVMQIPRSTYFVGETVTFTVTAFASTDPTLKIPSEMALVTVRNQSLVEAYSAWIVTDNNGSATVSWDIGLTAEPGNYTIILKPLRGTTVTETISVLYNEETYWKERVKQLEDGLNKQYEYINYLFNYNYWLNRQVKWVKETQTIQWLMVFMCLIVGLYCGMFLAANQPSTARGVLAAPGKLMRLLGIASPNPLYLQHEEVLQLETPKEKIPPIYGHDYVCKVCEKKGLPVTKMTKAQFEEHMWYHDRLALKRDSLRAKLRGWMEAREKQKNASGKEPEPAFGTVEEYAEAERRAEAVAQLKERLERLRKLRKKGLISDDVLKRQLAEIRAEKDKLAKKMPEPKKDAPQTATPAKPETQRKVRVERRLSTPVIGLPHTPDKVPAHTPKMERTQIDELYEKLSNEKVK